MSKFNDTVKQDLIARFQTGEIPDGADFELWLERLQQAIEHHSHTEGGGPDTGTGDAASLSKVAVGLGELVNERQVVAKVGGKHLFVQEEEPTALAVGDIWIETD